MNAQKTIPLDVSRILPRLYLGSDPPKGPALAKAGFSHLCLCAVERAHPPMDYPGVRVRHVPLDDVLYLSDADVEQAVRAAKAIADQLRRGARALITCAQGRNRSALVMGFCVRLITGWRGPHVVAHLKNSRAHVEVLSNPVFEAAVAGQRRDVEAALHRWSKGTPLWV